MNVSPAEPASAPPLLPILVVDDNLVNQLVAVGLLKEIGRKAEAVPSGEQALVALRRTRYAFVLMDCQMPVMDGWEATRRIRAVDSGVLNPAVPIIAMTASLMASDRDACRAAGMNYFLGKPVNAAELRWVAQAVEGNGSGLWRQREWDTLSDVRRGALPSDRRPLTFDEQAFAECRASDAAAARAQVLTCLKEVPAQLLVIEQALTRGDRSGAEGCAERLGAVASAVCGMALRQAAEDLRLSVRAGEVRAVRESLRRAREEFDLLSEVLESESRRVY